YSPLLSTATAPPPTSTPSLHDALPIFPLRPADGPRSDPVPAPDQRPDPVDARLLAADALASALCAALGAHRPGRPGAAGAADRPSAAGASPRHGRVRHPARPAGPGAEHRQWRAERGGLRPDGRARAVPFVGSHRAGPDRGRGRGAGLDGELAQRSRRRVSQVVLAAGSAGVSSPSSSPVASSSGDSCGATVHRSRPRSSSSGSSGSGALSADAEGAPPAKAPVALLGAGDVAVVGGFRRANRSRRALRSAAAPR